MAALVESELESRAIADAALASEVAALAREVVAQQALKRNRLEAAIVPAEVIQVDIPAPFELSAAKRALANDFDGVMAMTTWRNTPQGSAFWSKEYMRLWQNEALSPEARAIITTWIKLAEAVE